jgi:hypothetical protein
MSDADGMAPQYIFTDGHVHVIVPETLSGLSRSHVALWISSSILAMIANGGVQRRFITLLDRRPKWVSPLQARDGGKPDWPRFLFRVRGFTSKNAVLSVRRYLKDKS